MPSVEFELNIRTLGELAWVASRVGRRMISSQVEPQPESIRGFWQSLRGLQRGWLRSLEPLTILDDTDIQQLEHIATHVFTTDMVARVWGTILAGIDRRNGKSDCTRIARNAVMGLLFVRNHVLSRMLLLPLHSTTTAARLDRMRRRCDRWTDMLIGNIVSCEDSVDFAIDANRARDFGEEGQEMSCSTGQNPVDYLVAAGMRLGFVARLPDQNLEQAEYKLFFRSILQSLPNRSLKHNGSLLTDDAETVAHATSSGPKTSSVLIPGLTLDQLRERFQ